MQLIADSGSTKVDWRAIKDDGSIVEISTEGINPVFITPEEIVKILSQKLLPVIGPGVKNVYFYGAGVVSPQLIATLSESFKKVFPESETFAASDVLAAARALCGHNPGIACIMGTGSNSCFYDGENIAKNVRAGGFILGDEASGGILGKKLSSDFIKGLLPAHRQAEFDKRYDLDYMKVVEKVYKQPMPSRFLASFAPFINEFIADPYMENLVNTSFDEFFKRNISQYDYKNHTVNFVGSIAFYFKDKLVAAAERNGMKVGRVLKTPIEGLVEYHKGII